MALDVYYREDVERVILSDMVLVVQTALACGDNIEFLRGALVAQQSQALKFGVPWDSLVGRACTIVGDDLVSLLDAANSKMIPR